MSPGEREFGRLEGKVDGMKEQLTRLETTVLTTLAGHEQRIDSLEGTRDEGKGWARSIQVGKGVLTFVLAVAATFGIGKGLGI